MPGGAGWKNGGSFMAVYAAKVGITVKADGGGPLCARAMAPAKAIANSSGEVHDTALKAAETDAAKRALATFGKPFGLELYRKDKNIALQSLPAINRAAASPPTQPRFGLHPDDTTPIPRPLHYYGRRYAGLDD